MFDVGNILVGPGTLVLDGSALGWTRNGVHLSDEVEHFIVEDVDQVPGAFAAIKTNETVTVSTELVEATLENIKKGWGVDTAIDLVTSPGHALLKFGGDTAVPEHQLVFQGIAPNGKARTVTFFRAISVDFGEIVAAKADETVIPVTFRILLDMTKAEGERLGEFDDEL